MRSTDSRVEIVIGSRSQKRPRSVYDLPNKSLFLLLVVFDNQVTNRGSGNDLGQVMGLKKEFSKIFLLFYLKESHFYN